MNLENKLNEISDFLEEFSREQKKNNITVMTEIAAIKRGLYGDETNLVMGLMERQLKDESRLDKLESFKARVVWTAVGAVAGIEGLIHLIRLII